MNDPPDSCKLAGFWVVGGIAVIHHIGREGRRANIIKQPILL